MFEIRLGDVIDDYCIKCRRLTNHSIVSIVEGAAAKVRCRTCYNDHDYRNEIAPPTKKELKKLALFNEVLAGAPGAIAPLDGIDDSAEVEAVVVGEAAGEETAGEENVAEDAAAPTLPAARAAKPTKSKSPKSK